MHELLRGSNGERIEYDGYLAGFDKEYRQIGPPGFWKLERRQSFQEPTLPSWQAFSRGDWDQAMRLADARRPTIEEEYRQDAKLGIRTWWIKVVELPINPYTHWAFRSLRIRAQSGEQVRIVRGDQIRQFEKQERLPEMITLGSDVMYDLLYDENGLQEGPIRILDRDVIARCQQFIADLYVIGEDIESFYQREVANLKPPC